MERQEARIEAMQKALEACRSTFATYRDQHEQVGNHTRAAQQAKMVSICDAALNGLGPASKPPTEQWAEMQVRKARAEGIATLVLMALVFGAVVGRLMVRGR